MIVCSCNVLTDKQVAQVARSSQPRPPTISEVYICLDCQPRCGRCVMTIKKICDETIGVRFSAHGVPPGMTATVEIDDRARAPAK
jgi:bacterioferritin-associated ferredoxin